MYGGRMRLLNFLPGRLSCTRGACTCSSPAPHWTVRSRARPFRTTRAWPLSVRSPYGGGHSRQLQPARPAASIRCAPRRASSSNAQMNLVSNSFRKYGIVIHGVSSLRLLTAFRFHHLRGYATSFSTPIHNIRLYLSRFRTWLSAGEYPV